MKKALLLLVVLVMAFAMVSCSQPKQEAPKTDNATMQYIKVEDAAKELGNETYTFLDLRKAADYQAGHIKGSKAADMDSAKNGDMATATETMKKAIEGVDGNLVLICYSGKSYAQAGTNVLKELGYDMSKVFTLEGGMKAFEPAYPNDIEK